MSPDELLITIAIPLSGEHPKAVAEDVLESVTADYPQSRITRVVRHKLGVVTEEKYSMANPSR